MIDEKRVVTIKVTHPDPKIERAGAEALKNLLELIAEATGEYVEVNIREATDDE